MAGSLHISDYLPIQGRRICSIGNWGHHNFGDELILIGLMKLLFDNKNNASVIKKIYVSGGDIAFLRQFHRYFFDAIDLEAVHYIQEIPHGLRSAFRFVTRKITHLMDYFRCDTFVIGGGELFTEETPGSYLYRFWSLLPYWVRCVFAQTNLYVMGGMQAPKTRYNKLLLKRIVRSSKKCFLRDEESTKVAKQYGGEAEWFIDTSYFVPRSDVSSGARNYVIVNTNPLSHERTQELHTVIKKYFDIGYDVYFLPAFFTKNPQQNDMICYDEFKKLYPDIILLDRRKRDEFLPIFCGAKTILCSRLHVFLMAAFWGKDVQAYPYQKKIIKNKLILQACGIVSS